MMACKHQNKRLIQSRLMIQNAITHSIWLNKHNETQPEHLHLVDGQLARNYKNTQAQQMLHCCPAGVYNKENEQFSVRANRCLHCKCCEIKDPAQQVRWAPPEGGERAQTSYGAINEYAAPYCTVLSYFSEKSNIPDIPNLI